MSKIKSILLGFVKSEILNNLGMLDSLVAPQLAGLLTDKAKIPGSQAQALAGDVIVILKGAITDLLNKL